MNRTQARLALLKFSLVTCVVLSFLVGVSVWDARPSDSPSMVPDVVTAVARVPAAIPNLLNETKMRPPPRPGFQVWKSPCLGAGRQLKPMHTESGWLRIMADTCDSSLEITDSRLENVSNGYVATVFNPAPSHMTSDFIPLAEGHNVLQMELTLDSGEQFSYEWTVDRASIATN